MMIGYGPEAYFAEKPKAPKWTAKVRYKTTASVMRGMGGMMGAADDGGAQDVAAAAAEEEEGFGIGDLLGVRAALGGQAKVVLSPGPASCPFFDPLRTFAADET